MINFEEIKSKLSITSVIDILSLNHSKEPNGQLRMRCPACDSKDDRAIVVTPDKNLYYCFAKKVGGDQISLYAHIKGTGMKTAGEDLAQVIGAVPVKTEQKVYDLEEYGKKLDADHPAVTALMPPEIARLVGAGWCSKGILKDLVAIPVRLSTGKIAGYIGITDAKVPKNWQT